MASSGVPSVEPRLRDYLVANREFMAPVVEQVVDVLPIETAARILDMGTGAGGALGPLVRASAPAATVVAVDLDPGVIAMAEERAAAEGVAAQVAFHVGDVGPLLDASTAAGGEFDVIWASDVVWPGNFDDPGGFVRRLSGALAPGGVVALLYSNYYQAMFLPGRSRLERKLRTASELRWGLPADGPHHYERHISWLVEAGLDDVALRVFPRIGFPMDADPAARRYVELAVFPELRESLVACGEDAGMSAEEVSEAQRLLDPEHPDCLLAEPGYYLMHPTILATGRRS